MIHVVSDAEGVATAGARLVGAMLRGRIQQTDSGISLALSGGATPRRLYELLSAESGEKIPWPRISLFWGDERCVPPEDIRSNYGMAARAGLLERPFAGIHRMLGEVPPDEGALQYEDELKKVFSERGLPRFDLILLGLGSDGHVASVFPGSAGLTDRGHWILSTETYGGIRRLTVTLPVLGAARSLLFLVSGEAKAEAVRQTLSRETGAADQPVPARFLLEMISVMKKAGWECPSVTWVLDKAAASLLPTRRAP
jgi:6-phosphogluconolactonase